MDKTLFSFLVMLVINRAICLNDFKKNYDQFALYNIYPTDGDQLKFLQNLDKQKYIDVIFWNKPVRLFDEVQVMVNHNETDKFVERVGHFNLTAKLLLDNVEKALDEQIMETRRGTENVEWNSYLDLSEINQWLTSVEAKYPNRVDLQVIGKSYEGRDIYAVGLINRNTAYSNVIMEGGIHANEWISPTFVMFAFDRILHARFSSNQALKALVLKYNWFFIPVANPDGFEHSHKKDRLWRKNRAQYGQYYGVDLNRNFNFSFGKHEISTDPKSDVFCGPQPLSEPETKAVANFIHSKSENLMYYFAIHGYGEKIIVPFSDTVIHIDNFLLTSNLAKQAASKIYRKTKTKFSVGTNYDLFGYKVSGQSTDWVKRNYGVPFVYTLLLRDNGTFGHALPIDQIQPACEEALVGIIQIMTSRMKRILRADNGIYAFADRAPSLRHGNFVIVFVCLILSLLFLH